MDTKLLALTRRTNTKFVPTALRRLKLIHKKDPRGNVDMQEGSKTTNSDADSIILYDVYDSAHGSNQLSSLSHPTIGPIA